MGIKKIQAKVFFYFSRKCNDCGKHVKNT